MSETIALNRRARHDYTITDTFEAGLVLTGTEIKSVRARKVNLSDAYARVEKGEAWLLGAHIAPFEQGNRYNHEPASRPQAAVAPYGDRPADGPCRGQGPDRRAAAAVHQRQGPGQEWSLAWPKASSCTIAAKTSPIVSRSATWSASWPTFSAAGDTDSRIDSPTRRADREGTRRDRIGIGGDPLVRPSGRISWADRQGSLASHSIALVAASSIAGSPGDTNRVERAKAEFDFKPWRRADRRCAVICHGRICAMSPGRILGVLALAHEAPLTGQSAELLAILPTGSDGRRPGRRDVTERSLSGLADQPDIEAAVDVYAAADWPAIPTDQRPEPAIAWVRPARCSDLRSLVFVAVDGDRHRLCRSDAVTRRLWRRPLCAPASATWTCLCRARALGRGLGALLLDTVIAEARGRGFSRMHLLTHDDNDRAHGLYASRGLRTNGLGRGCRLIRPTAPSANGLDRSEIKVLTFK